MDCSAVVLNKILADGNIEAWSKLKLSYLDTAYSSLYSYISKHYEKFSKLPTFDELNLSLREGSSKAALSAVQLVDVAEIDLDVALTALVDQFTQNQTVNLLDKFVDKLPIYSSEEIKESLNSIVLELEERTHTSETVVLASDMMLFKHTDDLNADRTFLGLNNDFDSILNGVARQELILIGGKRGSGKSAVGCNIAVNQFENGNTAVIFTIEMTAAEIFRRNISILADIDLLALMNNRLSDTDVLKAVKARASMFEDAQGLVTEYLQHKDRFKFEAELVSKKKLKIDNQIVLIDDRNLTIPSIDLHLTKLKARFKDKFKVCVVDYINQIAHEKVQHGTGQYDWQLQIELAKSLKNLARKHEVVIVSPYQIDDSGNTRFAKGILDSCDIALIMDANSKSDSALSFHTTKIRSGPNIEFTSGISWESLRIYPVPIQKPGTESKQVEKPKEKADDIVPWTS